ncbi:MAG: DUF971 domain-containing protein [Nitratireductor sp.]|nr:DUF971 domain-containing protein [Nitratireductor sp.]MCC0020969.1 DUF971 domain-containing protein [Nitratireductor sp.]
MAQGEIWPTEIRLREGGSKLAVSFENGESYEMSAEYLRVESPSAEIQGHSPLERKFIGGKKNVKITEIAPVGNYAARLVFDDGHESGIFTWEVLHHLGKFHDDIWPIYLAKIAEKGLSR